jgi:hypothetical protein
MCAVLITVRFPIKIEAIEKKENGILNTCSCILMKIVEGK